MSARISLSTGSLMGYPLDRILAMAAGLGLDGVEVMLTDALLAAGPAPLLGLSERAALPILSVHFPIFGRRDEADRHAAYERTAAFAAALPSCEAVVVHTSLAPTLHAADGQAYLQALRRAQGTLRGTRVRLAVENRGVPSPPPRKLHLDDLTHLRHFVEEWDLALTYDVGHAADWGLDILQALETLGPRVRNIHLSDSRSPSWFNSSAPLHSHLRDHQPLGHGCLPLEALLRRLVAQPYDGLVTLELSPIALHLPWPWRMRERLAESVQRCRAALAAPAGADLPPRRSRRRPAPTDPA
jgi:sugar phosphate isomerase/epimerase